ncbi:MAG TPA: SPOR domain-containing protein, partial [Turneriella sp.]|nr:SPOR domain-containing protein [Turneriella sp.]
DVSYAAAKELGFVEKGVAKVHLELVQAGEDNFVSKVDSPSKQTKRSTKKIVPEDEIIEPVDFDDSIDAAADDDDEEIVTHKTTKKSNGKLVFLDGKKPKGYTIQVGAFKKKINAERHRDELLESYHQKSFIATNGKWHFVCMGDFKTREQAKAFLKKLSDDGVDVMYRGKVS